MSPHLGPNKLFRFSILLLASCLGLHLAFQVLQVPVIGHDDFLHLTWLEDFVQLRQAGINIPHWLPNSNASLGSPTFYFYPPLTYFLADALHSLAISGPSLGTLLFHATSAITLMLSGGALYWYLRTRLVSAQGSMLGALLYCAVPYRYADIFTRSALGEHVALTWIPLLLIAIDLARDKEVQSYYLKSILLSAIAWCALILSNIPATVVSAVFALCYAMPGLGKTWKRMLAVPFGGLLASLLAAFYLMPLVHFRRYIQTENLWNFDISLSKWHHVLVEIFDASAKRTAVHAVAIISILIAVLLIVRFLRSNATWSMSTKGLLAAGVACIFLQLPYLSDPLWNVAAPLHFLQFSWRFCIGLVIVTAGLFAVAYDLRLARTSTLLFSLAMISMGFYLRYAFIVSTYPAPPDQVGPYRLSANEYVNRYAQLPLDSLLPFVASQIDKPLLSSASDIRVDHLYENADTLIASITTTSRSDLHIKRFWWPQWHLTQLAAFEGHPVDVKLEPDSNGLIIAKNIAAGDVLLQMSIQESDAEKQGKIISLIGVIIFSILCIAGMIHTRRKA